MKPNFALTLSFDGIGLLHRVQGGWHLVGEVRPDAADLAADLAELAAKARALDPTGLRTKLVIPDEQIKYLAFETPERDVARIEALVRDALDGATPYALRDLSWDWSVRAGVVHVAAVARETLTEAEDFAIEHGFNPLCFVAMPEQTTFAAEPFFGETGYAARVLGPDEAVDREADVIRIVGAARMPAPRPAPEPVPKPAAATPNAAPAGEKPGPDAPRPKDRAAGPGRGRGGDKNRNPSLSGAHGPAAGFAFSSSRDPSAPPPDAASRPGALPRARLSATPAMSAGVGAAPKPPAAKPQPARPQSARPESPATPARAAKPAATAGAALGALLSRRKPARPAPLSDPKPARSRDAAVPPAPEPVPLAGSDLHDEAQRMTVFGARRGETAAPGGPRYLALILTVLLLLFLVGVAAWAALFLDDGLAGLFGNDDSAGIAAGPALPADDTPAKPRPRHDEIAPPPALAAPELAAPPPALAAPELAALPPDDGTGPPAPEPGAAPPPPPPARPEAIPETLTPDAARARYAATGIWQIAPAPPLVPGTTSRRDLYRIGLDAGVSFGAPPVLPPIDRLMPSPLPPAPGIPPPPRARFDLDARGFIAAVPEGTVTPDGVTIFAGPPPLKPPPTPPRATPEVLDDPTAAAPRTPGPRPRPRPANLSNRFDRTDLVGGRATDQAGLSDPRPASDTAGGQETDADSATPAATRTASTGEEATRGATAATAAALRPRPRPARFASIVEQSRQAAAADPVGGDQRMSVDIPTTASVARAATDRDRIALREVNLIGVYGSPSDRRALVRLANGNYRKVQVGDRLDGGQVAAIGAAELRYVKRGRALVLTMPEG